MEKIKSTIPWKEKRAKFLSMYGTLLILIGMMAIMTILKGNMFLSWTNIFNIMRQQTAIALMALGVMLPIITAGTDLSGGSVIALCGVVAAMLAHPLTPDSAMGEYPFIVPVLAGILTGALCGLINGVAISYGNVPPFIATLGMMQAARGMTHIISNGKPVNGFTPAFETIGGGSWLGIPVPIYILLGATIIMYFILHRSKFGTYVYAIGGNELAAKVSGIRVGRNKTMVYVIAGAFTGLASLVLTSRSMAGNPAAGVTYEMDAITGAVLGGTSFSGGVGTTWGTLIGALIMGVLTNGMTMLQIDPNLQMIVKGAVIVIAVLIDERKNRKNR
ncbi:MAG: ABC transporter permease [Christensenellales bacterium]